MILKGMFFYRLSGEERKPGFHYHGEKFKMKSFVSNSMKTLQSMQTIFSRHWRYKMTEKRKRDLN